MNKNICKIMFSLILITFIGFINIKGVKAATALIHCKYDLDFQGKNINFSVIYTDEKKLIYSIKDRSYNPDTGSRMWNYEKGFEGEFIKTIVNNNGSYNQCPNLSICYDDNQLLIHPGSHWCDPNYTGNVTAVGKTGTNKNLNVQEINTEKLICSKTSKDNVAGKNYKITLNFYIDPTGKKMIRLKPSNSNSSVEAEVTKGIFYEDLDYVVENDVINKMYSDEKTCNSTPIYFGNRDNSSAYNKVINITLTPPEDGEGALHGSINDATDSSSVEGFEDEDSGTTVDLKGVGACKLIGEKTKTGKIIKRIILIIKIFIPILIVILTVLDFLKVFASDDEKVYKQAWNRFIKRCAIGVVFFLIPALLKLIFIITDVLGIYEIDVNSIFCYLM